MLKDTFSLDAIDLILLSLKNSTPPLCGRSRPWDNQQSSTSRYTFRPRLHWAPAAQSYDGLDQYKKFELAFSDKINSLYLQAGLCVQDSGGNNTGFPHCTPNIDVRVRARLSLHAYKMCLNDNRDIFTVKQIQS